MKRAWKFVKAHSEWVYASVCVAVGIVLLVQEDTPGGLTLVGIGLLLPLLIHVIAWLANRVQSYPEPTRSAEELRALLSKGMEPVPIPGEDSLRPQHRVGTDPSCGICRDLMEGP